MAFKKKEIGFTEQQMKDIQAYADDNFDGNFNMAVRKLVRRSLEQNKSKV